MRLSSLVISEELCIYQFISYAKRERNPLKGVALQKIVITLCIMLSILSQVLAGSVVTTAHNMGSMQGDLAMADAATMAVCVEMAMPVGCASSDGDNNDCNCCDYDCASVQCFSVYPFDKIDFTWHSQHSQIIGYLDVALIQTTSLLYRPPIS